MQLFKRVASSGRSRLDYWLLLAMIGLVVLGALCVMSAVNSLSFSNPVYSKVTL